MSFAERFLAESAQVIERLDRSAIDRVAAAREVILSAIDNPPQTLDEFTNVERICCCACRGSSLNPGNFPSAFSA